MINQIKRRTKQSNSSPNRVPSQQYTSHECKISSCEARPSKTHRSECTALPRAPRRGVRWHQDYSCIQIQPQIHAFYLQLRVPKHVRMLLWTSNVELWCAMFSHPSQSECHRGPPTSSSGARLFHTPLSQNATLDLQLRALARDFFTPLSIRMLLWTSNFELWRATFSHPSQS